MQRSDVAEVLGRPLSTELLKRDLVRLGYVAEDGTPRVVPMGFTWTGERMVLCSPPNAPKLPGLRANPAVALTIDTEEHPPKILLIRGTVELDPVEGIPEEFLDTSGYSLMTEEQRVEWEREVRALYVHGMVRIVVTPTWAKLIDFETTLPSAVDELNRERTARG